MMRFVFFLLFLLFASAADASLSSSQLAQVLGTSIPNKLPASYNILQTTNLVDFRSLHILSNGVELLVPSAASVASADSRLVSSSLGKVFIRRGIGLLGPVVTIATLGMTAKDLYDAACGSGGSSAYPSINSFCSHSSAVPALAPLESKPAVGAIIVVNGNNYQLTSEQYTGSSTAGYVGWITNVGGNGPGTFGVKWGLSSSNVNGTTMYTYNFTYYKYSVPSTVPNVASTQSEFENYLTDSNGYLKPDSLSDADNILKNSISTDKVAMEPSADQIKTLTNTVQQDKAIDSAQEAVDSAQDAYDTNPTAEALQALKEAKAALEAQKAASARDDVVAPPVPDSGDYDSGIELPEKNQFSLSSSRSPPDRQSSPC